MLGPRRRRPYYAPRWRPFDAARGAVDLVYEAGKYGIGPAAAAWFGYKSYKYKQNKREQRKVESTQRYEGYLNRKLAAEKRRKLQKRGGSKRAKRKRVASEEKIISKMPRYGKRKYRRRSKSRKRASKRVKKRATGIKRINKALRTLSRRANNGVGTLRYKRISVDTASSAGGSVNHVAFVGSQLDTIRRALQNLPVYDPVDQKTNVCDFSVGTFQREIEYASTFSKITLRNNYALPCKMTCWLISPKSDTSISPVTAIIQGLGDTGNATVTDPLIYPSDSIEFMDLFKIHKRYDALLVPGMEVTYRTGFGPFMFDLAFEDSHNLQYQKKFKSHIWLVRLQGVIAHGTTSGNSLCQSKLDIKTEIHYVVKYDANADLHTNEIDDLQDLIGTAKVVNIHEPKVETTINAT
jgi:hypothetical protein